MSNPWDNDPVAGGSSTAAAPWSKDSPVESWHTDPVVSPWHNDQQIGASGLSGSPDYTNKLGRTTIDRNANPEPDASNHLLIDAQGRAPGDLTPATTTGGQLLQQYVTGPYRAAGAGLAKLAGRAQDVLGQANAKLYGAVGADQAAKSSLDFAKQGQDAADYYAKNEAGALDSSNPIAGKGAQLATGLAPMVAGGVPGAVITAGQQLGEFYDHVERYAREHGDPNSHATATKASLLAAPAIAAGVVVPGVSGVESAAGRVAVNTAAQMGQEVTTQGIAHGMADVPMNPAGVLETGAVAGLLTGAHEAYHAIGNTPQNAAVEPQATPESGQPAKIAPVAAAGPITWDQAGVDADPKVQGEDANRPAVQTESENAAISRPAVEQTPRSTVAQGQSGESQTGSEGIRSSGSATGRANPTQEVVPGSEAGKLTGAQAVPLGSTPSSDKSSTLRPVAEAQGAGRTPPPEQTPQATGGNIKTIFHGTDKNFDEFDVTKSADGSIWFTDNKSKLQNGDVVATGRSRVVERLIDEGKLKLGGYDEADKYSTDQLISMGYDGLKFDDGGETQYQIFHPEKLGKPFNRAAPAKSGGITPSSEAPQSVAQKQPQTLQWLDRKIKLGEMNDAVQYHAEGLTGNQVDPNRVAGTFFQDTYEKLPPDFRNYIEKRWSSIHGSDEGNWPQFFNDALRGVKSSDDLDTDMLNSVAVMDWANESMRKGSSLADEYGRQISEAPQSGESELGRAGQTETEFAPSSRNIGLDTSTSTPKSSGAPAESNEAAPAFPARIADESGSSVPSESPSSSVADLGGPTKTESVAAAGGDDPRKFSPKHEDLEREAKILGIDSLPSKERLGKQQAIDEAVKRGIPDKAMALAAEVNASPNENPRALDPIEKQGLNIQRSRIARQYDKLTAQFEAATDPADKATISAQRNRLAQDDETLMQAIHKSGSAAGKALQSQQNAVDENESLVSTKSRATIAAGRKLTPTEDARIESLHKNLQDANSKIETLQQQMNDRIANESVRSAKIRKPATVDLASKNEQLRNLLNAGCE